MIKKRWKIYILIVVLILAASPRNGRSLEPQEKKKLLLNEVSFYPAELEESLGKAFVRMLYTRLFPYFEVIEKEPGKDGAWDYILNLSLTRIGDGVSIDFLLTDGRGAKTRRYLTGENTGEIPGLLEDLSFRLNRIAYGKEEKPLARSVKPIEAAPPDKEMEGISSRISSLLPRGKLRFSPSYGGGYFRFSGGDVNLDGKDEVVAVSEKGITVVRIKEDTAANLYTYELKKDEKVLYLSCGDINRDRSSEIVATIVGSYGVRGLVVYYDHKEKKFTPLDMENVFLRILSGREGTVLLSQPVASGGNRSGNVEINRLKGREIEMIQSIPVKEGVSLEYSTPVLIKGSYSMLEYGGGTITLLGANETSVKLDEVIEELRTYDLDGDGNQEIMVFLSMVEKSRFFESLSVKKGFAVEVYRITDYGLKRDYRFDNELLKAGGFFPRFSASGAVAEFVVIALQGNDFFPPSITWKEVRVR
jgi:hypothetical protein